MNLLILFMLIGDLQPDDFNVVSKPALVKSDFLPSKTEEKKEEASKVQIARGQDGFSVWMKRTDKWVKISEGRRWQPKICTPQGCIPGRWVLIPLSEIKIPK